MNNMTTTKAQRELRRIEDANRLHAQRVGRAQRGGCPSHPEWSIPADQPRSAFAASLCPLCASEAVAERDQKLHDRLPVRKIDPGSAGDHLDFAYYLWREKCGASGIESGSLEEAEALEAIIDARYEDEARESAKGVRRPAGVLVSARPEGGRWVETYRVNGRYVRVGPE